MLFNNDLEVYREMLFNTLQLKVMRRMTMTSSSYFNEDKLEQAIIALLGHHLNSAGQPCYLTMSAAMCRAKIRVRC